MLKTNGSVKIKIFQRFSFNWYNETINTPWKYPSSSIRIKQKRGQLWLLLWCIYWSRWTKYPPRCGHFREQRGSTKSSKLPLPGDADIHVSNSSSPLTIFHLQQQFGSFYFHIKYWEIFFLMTTIFICEIVCVK